MKKILFILMAVCCAMGIQAKKTLPFVVFDYVTNDTLGRFCETGLDEEWHQQIELTFTEQTRIYIREYDKDAPLTSAWVGPKWDGLKSTLADENGYCWWNYDDFATGDTISLEYVTTSGTNNHIGLVMPEGTFLFEIDKRVVTVPMQFRVKPISPTALVKVKGNGTHISKVIIDGQLFIIRDGIYYDVLGKMVE